MRHGALRCTAALVPALLLCACEPKAPTQPPLLRWYSYNERSGAFAEVAERCTEASGGRFRLQLVPLPADADQQREQLVRRLAAGDADIDLVGMDVIWTAEFAEAGWILPWSDSERAAAVTAGRLSSAIASARYREQLWAAPFTSNAQLLWYRKDRIGAPPATWDALTTIAQARGEPGLIQVQGARYEGLTVFFVSLLASAGGAVLDASGEQADLPEVPTRTALALLKRIASSPAADPGLSTAREDQNRLAFESGRPDFMVNYSYVHASALVNAPGVAAVMGWSRWPGLRESLTSRVAVGGLNLAVSAHSMHPELAFQAATCLVSAENQQRAAVRGGLPPTLDSLYDDPELRRALPFADLLRDSLREAVQRPKTPLYSDVSLAILRVLHPPADIDPERDVARLRDAVNRALNSRGLL